MALVRVVDAWLRSPLSPPTYQRTVMVIAERWAEQRVLMRAFAACRDQLRPTIMLHGLALPIGPAGVDASGPWGVHVESFEDGWAQTLAGELEQAARRLAGSRGNPPRLADEPSTFEDKPTNSWAPGVARDVPTGSTRPRGRTVPPMIATASAGGATFVPYAAGAPAAKPRAEQGTSVVHPVGPGIHPVISVAPTGSSNRRTPLPMVPEVATPPPGRNARTALGYSSGAGAQSALLRLGLRPALSARLGRFAHRVVSNDFQLSTAERHVIEALDARPRMTARAIGTLIGADDPVGWMEALIQKLERAGLDLIEPGDPQRDEPTYVLRV